MASVDEELDEERLRQIIREEIHAYETKLINFNAEECVIGIANRDEAYKKFIDEVLLNDTSKTKTD